MTRTRRALFASVPLVLAVLVLELGVRATTPPEVSTDYLPPHRSRLWQLPPGDYANDGAPTRIDEHGLRVVETTGAPLRALTLGDSSIFGHGLPAEQTLHASLRRALSERGVEADVLCGGVPGYSTEQSLELLFELGEELAPDLLVLGGLWSDYQQESFHDREFIASARSPAASLRRWMVANSALAAWMEGERAGRTSMPVSWVKEPSLDMDSRVPLDQYVDNQRRLADWAADHGAEVVTLAPCHRMRFMGGQHPWEPWFEALEANPGALAHVDACSVLRSQALAGDQAFLDDLHPTAASNEAYGQALAAALVEAGWPTTRSASSP